MSPNGFFAVAMVLALTSELSADDAEAKDSIVHEAGTEVGFHRECADAEPFRVQAYASLRSDDGRGRALARLYARRDPVRREEVFVGMDLVAMEVEAGRDWGDAPYAVRLDARSGIRQVMGPDYTTYSANPAPGMGEERTFRTDGDGRTAWLDFVEPTEPEGKTDRSHNWSPSLEATATELGLDESDRRVRLGLTLANGETDDEIRLTGPALWIPDRVWNQVPPKPRTLGLFGMLNPFDEGSVWAWLSNAARYGHCVDERRYAKRWFRQSSFVGRATGS